MHALTISRTSPHSAAVLYRAFTTGWGMWFAERETARVRAIVGEPFFFEVVQRFDDAREPVRHPHYGRFLRVQPNALVSLTWSTGLGGTGGAETVLTVHLDAIAGDFTRVTVTHAGFATPEARDAHERAWPMILAHQDVALRDVAQQDVSETDVVRPNVVAPDVARESDASRAPVGDSAPAVSLPPNRSVPGATFIPVRSYPDVDLAVRWLRDVLGARERLRVAGQRVQLSVGDGAMVVMAWDATATPATGGRPPAVLMVRVPDVDAAYGRALALGATALMAPADHVDGERQASVRDPAGHAWTLTQTIADVDPAGWGGELMD